MPLLAGSWLRPRSREESLGRDPNGPSTESPAAGSIGLGPVSAVKAGPLVRPPALESNRAMWTPRRRRAADSAARRDTRPDPPAASASPEERVSGTGPGHRRRLGRDGD